MKPGLRQHYMALLRQQSPAERAAKSRRIAAAVRQLAAYGDANYMFCYVALLEEVDTAGIIRRALADGKAVCVPKLLDNQIVPVALSDPDSELRHGHYNIPEPFEHDGKIIKAKEIDLALVPGLAFDESGNRLGRGRGHFDRFLPQLSKATIAGLAFDCQIASQLPAEEHDHRVNFCLTERRTIRS